MSDEKQTVEFLDIVSDDACPRCGNRGWIIDGCPIERRAWLLCLDPKAIGCVETKPLPPQYVVAYPEY